MLLAAIDIGTNSTRLLMIDFEGNELKTIERDLVTTRIGEGVSGTGLLGEEGMKRTLQALCKFKKVIDGYGEVRLMVAATSAVRDAKNRDEFIQRVSSELNWELRVLTGREEACLSYAGVTQGLELPPNPLVIDVGGGSTEFIWQEQGAIRVVSVNAGAVRMTEKEHSRDEIKEILKPALVEICKSGPGVVIGVGGTVTTLAAIDQQLTVYNSELVHGYTLTSVKVRSILEKLESLDIEARKIVPGLQPERADIILKGIVIVDEILSGVNASGLIASEYDILHGMIFDLLNQS